LDLRRHGNGLYGGEQICPRRLIPGEKSGLGFGQHSRNGGPDPRVRQLNGLGKHFGDIATATDQISMKVPAWNILPDEPAPCSRTATPY